MSRAVLILGESGTGKSTSIRNLNPEETVIINIVGKELPFKGHKVKYPLYDKETKKGKMFITDNWKEIKDLLVKLGAAEKIRNIIIDDFQYLMSYEFMARAKETGFNKFTEIAQHAFEVIDTAKNLPQSKTVFFLSHIENGTDVFGNKQVKIKTIGESSPLFI